MPPDQNQNINLLPGDLKRKREVIKKVISDDVVRYTQPQNGHKESVPEEKKSSISFWGRRGASSLRVSKEKFTLPAKTKNGGQALATPKPNFLSQGVALAKKEPEKIKEVKPESREAKKDAKLKPSFWQRLFGKKMDSVARPALRGSPQNDIKKESAPAPTPTPVSEPSKPASVMLEPRILRDDSIHLKTKMDSIAKFTPSMPEGLQNDIKKEPALPPVEPVKEEPPKVETPKIEVEKPKEEPFDVNLLSKEYAEVFKVRNQKSVLLSWSVAAVVVVLLAYAGVYLYQLKKSANIRKTSQINIELEKTIATYSSLEQEDALLLQKISSLKTLLGSHISLTKFLTLLEAATTPEVTYTAIAASRQGLVTITALAIDYTQAARQLSIFQEHTPWVTEAQITAAQLSKDNQAKTRGVEFDLLLKVDKSVFNEAEASAPK